MEFRNSLRLVLAGSLLSLASVVAVVFYLMDAISDGANQQDYTRSYRAVEVAIETERTKMASLISDNAVWNDAVRQSYGSENRSWLGETWGVSTGLDIYTIFLLLDEHDRTIVSYDRGEESALTLEDLVGDGKAAFLGDLPRDGTAFEAAADFFRTQRGIMVLGAGPIVPGDDSVAIPGARARLLVFGKIIDPETIAAIAEKIVVSDLHLRNTVPAEPEWSHAPVDNRAGEAVAYAVWHDLRPGDIARKAVELPTMIVIAALVGTTLWLILTAWRAGSELRKREKQASIAARRDALTGLANRYSFHERLEASLAERDNRSSLLFIDLDGFKLINDMRGHRVGDILLKQVADRLREACAAPGMAIGRLGGDEFAVLIPNDDSRQARAFAADLVRVLSMPFDLGGDSNVRIGASIGIALAPRHAKDGETLLSRADIALYAAKEAGKGTFRLFLPDMEAKIQDRMRLEAQLRTALQDRVGLFVFYQSIIDIGTGRVTAREALLRWCHEERGWISPGEFVPVAEQSGLIDPLGLFVLRRACHDAAQWDDGARVAVNVSAGQLGKGTLAPAVLEALVRSGLPPDRLEIEVTETALLHDEKDSIGDLRRLRDMGVRVALDDFGTGYSSLAHLRAFPFDKIKIDGTFVRDAVDRPDCAAVVRAIADLGKCLHVTTVAEGVETQAQLDRVTEEGCSEAQGYLFSRPVPSEADMALVDELNRALGFLKPAETASRTAFGGIGPLRCDQAVS
ncbi:EAL domain-containing protein [Rhizobiaceae bacterium BDR2-2]|uniref:EAL domain-containing protein n=1 Tax=Ectorhizobium quercum TaxID=2965071 RepID=A0AAE3SV60_9HYPH|nr:EAL domain-containing protein [Ectorhizobium quercum]MCX8997388.1 EAL domain-containing protein [Ectorhizobium quercum]